MFRATGAVLIAFLAIPAVGGGTSALPPTPGQGLELDHLVIGAGGAGLYPSDVVATKAFYYVLDPGNDRVVKIKRSTGAIVATASTDAFSRGQTTSGRGLGGPDRSGNIYVTDSPGDAIARVSPDLTLVNFIPPKKTDAPNMDGVNDVAVGPGLDASGNPAEIVYVSEKTRLANGKAGLIRKFLPDGTYIGAIGSQVPTPRKFKQMVIDRSNGDLYTVDGVNWGVKAFAPDGTLKLSFGGKGTGPGLFTGEPRGITLGKNGDIYVTDSDNYRIQVFSSSGKFQFMFGGKGTTDSTFTGPRGITMAPDQTLVVCDLWGYALKEFSPDGTLRRKLFGVGPSLDGVNLPKGISLNPDNPNRLDILDWWSQRIVAVNTDGTNAAPLGGTGARNDDGALTFPRDVEAEPGTGRLYVANRESHEVQVLNPDGTSFGQFGAFPQMVFPQGVEFAPDGTLWVSNSGRNEIIHYRIEKSGLGTIIATYGDAQGRPGSRPGTFHLPGDMATTADGSLYVADTKNGRIQELSPSGTWTVLPLPAGVGRISPWGIDIGPDGGIWVTDPPRNRVIKMRSDGTVERISGGSYDGRPLDAPQGVQVGKDGIVYVADGDGDRVLALREVPLPSTSRG